jgi:hypothetical protein
MTFIEACELLTEILVGKKPKKKRKVVRRTGTKTRRRYTRRKSK